ncbi:MAG: hypothetical protein QOF67_814, partial [Mycobacterium sp.]|nr:hypothetical protein [Mycobacterium sp.]
MRWLLIRGLSRDARHWGSFPQTFAEELGVEVQTIDPPGFGTQITRTSPSTIAEITDDIRDRANIQGDDWSILGISLGGMVTLDWVARYPNEFERAVVINTSASDVAPLYARAQPAFLRAIATAVIRRDIG